MLSRRKKQIMKRKLFPDWKKYSFEFLSIFVAVISAFALNNWNDNRRDNIIENRILNEIYIGLGKDLEDIRLNESGHKNGIEAVIYFRNLLIHNAGLNTDTISNDSLMQHYFNLTRDFVSIQNTSGYEMLKSKGLELIKNDTLRTEIIALYEYDYNTLRKLEEEYYELQFQKNYFREINQVFSKNFIVDEQKMLTGIAFPLDITDNEEKMMLTYLWKIQVNRVFITNYYSEIKERIEKIKIKIEQELQG